jgi:hypothetical protein
MRRIEFGRRREEASCGVPHELLNRGSQVRILSPAPNPIQSCLIEIDNPDTAEQPIANKLPAERALQQLRAKRGDAEPLLGELDEQRFFRPQPSQCIFPPNMVDF